MVFPQSSFPDNKEALNAYNLAEHTNKSVYITGKAGTGKSTFLKQFCGQTKKTFVILAPTGIAALNAGGQTIHSFFNLPTRPFMPNDPGIPTFAHAKIQDGKIVKEEHQKRKLIKQIEMIIIDEISMVRADIIDAIDTSLRKNGGKPDLPFGGKQMVFIGDLFQLEPIVKDEDKALLKKNNYKGRFFFNAQAFSKIEFSKIEFLKVYRQSDRVFIDVLERIRTKKAMTADFELLNRCVKPQFIAPKDEVIITLCPTNENAEKHNEEHLKNIKGKDHNFRGKVEGNFNSGELPIPMILNLKIGAQVMFVRNDPQNRWVNGTIGKVTSISEQNIKVRIKKDNKEKDYQVEKSVWLKVEYSFNDSKRRIETKETGSYEQFPIKLAWAITIHKSQGLTFDNVIIDSGRGMFAHGQLYVALSRCTSLEGLIFKNRITEKEMIVHPRVIDFSNEANNQGLIDREFLNGVIEKNEILSKEVSELKIELELLRDNLREKEEEITDLSAIVEKHIKVEKKPPQKKSVKKVIGQKENPKKIIVVPNYKKENGKVSEIAKNKRNSKKLSPLEEKITEFVNNKYTVAEIAMNIKLSLKETKEKIKALNLKVN